MATYSSSDYTNKTGVAGSSHRNAALYFFWSVSCTAAPSTSDTINFGYVPAGFRCTLAVLESTDMDTNGAPSLTINVGDSGDADRIFAASTVGQAGTVSRAIQATGAGYQYPSKTLITGVAHANAATGAAGTLYLTLIGFIDTL